jgi:hypothetical protein
MVYIDYMLLIIKAIKGSWQNIEDNFYAMYHRKEETEANEITKA